ncbi:MAG: hypothetical protein QXW41_07250 [Fervidicoccaceae archaeon]
MSWARRVLVLAVLVIVVLVALGAVFSTPRRTPEPVFQPVIHVEPSWERTYPVLKSLDQLLIRDPLMSEVWRKLPEFDAGDPRVSPYLEWVARVVEMPSDLYPYRNETSEPYILIDIDYPDGGLRPAGNTKVKLGYARLPLGFGVIITAYQDEKGEVNVVVHGTVLNETEFYRFYTRVIPLVAEFDYGATSPELLARVIAELEEKGEPVPYNFTVYWVLWRATLHTWFPGELGDGYPGRVHILIEMPLVAFGTNKPHPFSDPGIYIFHPERLGLPENTYFIVFSTNGFEQFYFHLAHPVFAVASKLTGSEPLHIASETIFYGVIPEPRGASPQLMSPLHVKIAGRKWCQPSTAVALVLASAMGYPMYEHCTGAHAIAMRWHPSLLGESGPLNLSDIVDPPSFVSIRDLDFDGAPDTASVFLDTANYPLEVIVDEMRKGYSRVEYVCIPGFCYMPVATGGVGRTEDSIHLLTIPAYVGVPQYLLGLPDWLKTPAFTVYQVLTEKYLREVLGDRMRESAFGVLYTAIQHYYLMVIDESTGRIYETYYPPPYNAYGVLHGLEISERVTLLVLTYFGITAEDFKPPSRVFFDPVAERVEPVYEDTRPPDTEWFMNRVLEGKWN